MRRTIDYAIADVHGRVDLLMPLVVACLSDAAARGASSRFVFIGDIIDRGPTSRDCLDVVSEILTTHEGSVCLKGNHEDLATAVLMADEPDEVAVANWLENGGGETLESYHPDHEIGFEMMRTLNGDHVRLMAEAQTSLNRGGFFFAHAGVDPAKAFRDQRDRDLMWTRKTFLDHVGHLEQVVIHGHSIMGDLPVVTENRVSIDTGAYCSGRLTACAVDNGDLRFMQTDGSGRKVVAVEPVRLDRGLGTCLASSLALAA
jgi:serine/threonine protein phosphatase 1